MGLPPVKLTAEAELVDKSQEIAIGTADEVVEPLDRVALEAEGAGQAAEIRGGLEQDDAVPSSRQIVAGGQPGQAAPDDDDALGFHRDWSLARSTVEAVSGTACISRFPVGDWSTARRVAASIERQSRKACSGAMVALT